MANRIVSTLGCLLIPILLAAPAGGGEAAPEPPPEKAPPAAQEKVPEVKAPERVSLLDQAKHPLPFFTWGGDIRIRQEYQNNAQDFDRHLPDQRNAIRTRYRLWGRVGPFLEDPDLAARKVPTGLSFYGRLCYEPRYYSQYEPKPTPPVPYPDWNEVVVDNLYADWQRIGGLPISLRLGRQDLDYGRKFIFGDATFLDGSRTAYFDACKLTLHLDRILPRSQIDFLGIHNRADESARLRPWNWADVQKPVAEYDVDARGVYFSTKYFQDHEIGAYTVSKHDDPIPAYVAKKFKENTIRTTGLIVQGRMGPWDYYAEGATQHGRYGDATRPVTRQSAYAFSGDLGYTFQHAGWTPRLHGEYECLSGDDPRTQTHEGWDPVFARWPRWSEVFYNHLSKEYGRSGYWTNLQRFTIGVSAKPIRGLTLSLDESLLLANEHDHGTTGTFGRGLTRGLLCSPKIICDLDQLIKMDRNLKVQMHLWLDYFRPGAFYAGDSDALFFRWQILITF